MKRATRKVNMVRRLYPCRLCSAVCKRHCIGTRKVKCLYRDLIIRYSKHYCMTCDKYTSVDMLTVADKQAHYSHKVKEEVIRLSKFTMTVISRKILTCYGIRLPLSTIHEWLVDERA